MIVGLIGSQKGMTNFQKDEFRKLIKIYGATELTHGDCIGSDKESNEIALDERIKNYTLFPSTLTAKRAFLFIQGQLLQPTWEWFELESVIYGLIRVRRASPKAPLDRNQDIVNYCGILIATPKEFKHTVRSGTWATIRLGWVREKRDKNFKVIVIPPLERDDESV